jgi:hypothetical protein
MGRVAQLRLRWEPVWTTDLDDYDVYVFADGSWEINMDGNEDQWGRAPSVAQAKRDALGALGRSVRWCRGARYLGRRYCALVLPPPLPDPLLIAKGWQNTEARWEIEELDREDPHPITSYSTGKSLARGSAPSVRAGQRLVERLLRRPPRPVPTFSS